MNPLLAPAAPQANPDRRAGAVAWWAKHRLALARAGGLALIGLALAYFVLALPVQFVYLQTVCDSGGCALTTAQARDLAALGLPAGFFAGYFLVVNIAVTLPWFAVGGIIYWRRRDDFMALFTATSVITYGAITASISLEDLAGYPALQALFTVVAFWGNTSSFLLFYLFPDGRFVPRTTRYLAIPIVGIGICLFFFPTSAVTQWLISWRFIQFIAILASGVFAQLYRYWRVSGPAQRQQTKWVVLGFTGAVVGTLGPQTVLITSGPHGILASMVASTVVVLAQLLIPLSIGAAILRYRLWDINILISRTLVYGALTAIVVVLYVLLVGVLSTLFQATSNLLISLVATGLVAVLFQPLREHLQRSANHLLYGERDDPYALLSRLGQRLEATLAPEALLPAIVETTGQALKLPYVAILIRQGDALHLAAAYGMAPDPATLVRLPLVSHTERVGELALAPRAPGESFAGADLRLLQNLAQQMAVAVHNVRLTADLRQLTAELQQSRERLVVAREEERRRLRRDLHDGLGPQLASQTLTLSAARTLLRRDPDAAETLLADATAHAQQAITDIRRLIYALRPPALDDLGLVAALQEQIHQYRASGVAITLRAPEQLPPLPAAVEVACYRIAQEALTNVVRHAHARNCAIQITIDSAVALDISDDGQGLPPVYQSGVGLNSMRELAAELSGTFAVEPGPSGGTWVRVRLPLP